MPECYPPNRIIGVQKFLGCHGEFAEVHNWCVTGASTPLNRVFPVKVVGDLSPGGEVMCFFRAPFLNSVSFSSGTLCRDVCPEKQHRLRSPLSLPPVPVACYNCASTLSLLLSDEKGYS